MNGNNELFPARFSEANQKLRMRFRFLDSATIEDGIQYARIEYWKRGINEQITDEGEALAWLLNVARRYLSREVKRLNRHYNISAAADFCSGFDIERQFIYNEVLHWLEGELSQRTGMPTLLMHAAGYSLQEVADHHHISLSAAKQRHSRERISLRKKEKYVFQ